MTEKIKSECFYIEELETYKIIDPSGKKPYRFFDVFDANHRLIDQPYEFKIKANVNVSIEIYTDIQVKKDRHLLKITNIKSNKKLTYDKYNHTLRG